jgi:hypothetical protein
MRRAARIDATAPALVQYAKSIGFDYLPINGVIDGVLAYGSRAVVIDWKSPGKDLTPAQSKLVARGFPLKVIHKAEQLDQLKQELSR